MKKKSEGINKKMNTASSQKNKVMINLEALPKLCHLLFDSFPHVSLEVYFG